MTFELVTERGAVLIDGFKQNLTIYSHDVRRPLWTYWGPDMNQAMIDEFVAAIRETREPRVTGKDGHRAVEFVVAAYESTQTGSRCASNEWDSGSLSWLDLVIGRNYAPFQI